MSKKKPEDRVRIGAITCSIWKNASENGNAWYNVTLQRAYRTDEGWEYSDSLGRDDLLVAAKVLDHAYDRIVELQAEDKAQDA